MFRLQSLQREVQLCPLLLIKMILFGLNVWVFVVVDVDYYMAN